MAGFGSRIKHAWNAFLNQTPTDPSYTPPPGSYGPIYSSRPDRLRLRITNERSILSAILTRMAIDVASVDIRHVRLDDEERYIEDIGSGLNECLQIEANIDQGARAFRQDIAASLFDDGCIAIVPVDTSLNPNVTGSYEILSLRVGKICQWYPRHVRVSLYNEKLGIRQEVTLEKKFVAIIENPLYNVMNEHNSTLQRIIRKLALLDVG